MTPTATVKGRLVFVLARGRHWSRVQYYGEYGWRWIPTDQLLHNGTTERSGTDCELTMGSENTRAQRASCRNRSCDCDDTQCSDKPERSGAMNYELVRLRVLS